MNRTAPGTECGFESFVVDLRFLHRWRVHWFCHWFYGMCNHNGNNRPFRLRWYHGGPRCFFVRRRGGIRSACRGRHLATEIQQFAMQRIILLNAQVSESLELLAEFALPP